MLFNSLEFFVFFIVVTTAYFSIPHRFRWCLLLAASCYFYMAFIPAFILILAFTITVDYFAGIAIERAAGVRRKQFLIASILANIGVLFFFKYFNFFNANLAALADFLHWNYSIKALSIILPIGLSFHVFQSLSYTIEVYRGKQKAERHFGILAVYVMFYPQLVAGPIERPQNLLHQFREEHRFDTARVVSGLERILWGLFKKVVIADRAGAVVNLVYAQLTEYHGVALVLASILFAFQLYCDFSGYSDIAIGSARVMGFRLMENFNRPYFSRSISEFWRRWHISLSTWFRDYLFTPLAHARARTTRSWLYVSIIITFLASGLWHGANWTYVIWGGLNGCYLAIELYIKNSKTFGQIFRPLKNVLAEKYVAIGQVLLTFSLTCLTLVFFRAASVGDALYVLKSSLIDGAYELMHLHAAYDALRGLGATDILFVGTAIISLLLLEYFWIQPNGNFKTPLSFQKHERIFRYTRAYVLITLILVFGLFVKHNFIYFQF